MSKVNSNLVFLLLTLNIFDTFSSVSIVDFKRVNVNWVYVHLVFFLQTFLFSGIGWVSYGHISRRKICIHIRDNFTISWTCSGSY